MRIPQRQGQVQPKVVETFKRPESTAEVEGLQYQAQQAGYKTRQKLIATNIVGDIVRGGIRIGDQIAEAQALKDLAGAENATNQALQDLTEELTTTGIPMGEWEGVADEKLSNISVDIKNAMTSKRGQEYYDKWFAQKATSFKIDVQERLRKTEIELARVEIGKRVGDAAGRAATDPRAYTEAMGWIAGAEAAGLYRPEEAEKMRNSVSSHIAETIAWDRVSKRAGEEGDREALKEAVNLLYSQELKDEIGKQGAGVSGYLTAEMQEDLQERLVQRSDFMESLQKEKYDADQKAMWDKAIELNVEDKLTLEMFQKGGPFETMEPSTKDNFTTALKDKRKNEEEEADQKIYDTNRTEWVNAADKGLDPSGKELTKANLEKSGLRPGDVTAVWNVYKIFKGEQEEDFDQDLFEQYKGAYERIQDGEITKKEQLRDGTEYDLLNQETPEAQKYLKELDGYLKVKDSTRNPDTYTDHTKASEYVRLREDPTVENAEIDAFIAKFTREGISITDAEAWSKEVAQRDRKTLDLDYPTVIENIDATVDRWIEDFATGNPVEVTAKTMTYEQYRDRITTAYDEWWKQNDEATTDEKLAKVAELLAPINDKNKNQILKTLEKAYPAEGVEAEAPKKKDIKEIMKSEPEGHRPDPEGNPTWHVGDMWFRKVGRKIEYYDVGKREWLTY